MPSLSVRAILMVVVSASAAAITAFVSQDVWVSWQRLKQTEQVVEVTAATHSIFTAMPMLRLDRSNTNRVLNYDAAQTSVDPQVEQTRAVHEPAVRAALTVLGRIAYPDGARLYPELKTQADTVAALAAETLVALRQPKEARRAGLAEDYVRETTKLIDVLERNLAAAGRSVQLIDGIIDKLFDVKTILWQARSAAGDATLLASNAVGGLPTPRDAVARFDAQVLRSQAGWLAAKAVLDGVDVDRSVGDAFAAGDAGFFAPAALDMQRGLLAKAAAGLKLDLTSGQWNEGNVPRLASVLAPAQAAMDAANRRAGVDHAEAVRHLVVNAGLLAAAIVVALAAVLLIERRVVRPLGVIRDRMTRLSAGDLATEAPYTARGDEIGALGKAMAMFRDGMIEAERLRAERAAEESRIAALRRGERDGLADRFDTTVGGIIGRVAAAAGELQTAATALTAAAEATSARSASVAAASEQASANVASVASATDELSTSVNEIGRQVAQSAEIARRAVGEANQTNAQVRGLASAADRIGSVVDLINNIASQTNLLALNATIEAARAGAAGKGFAVVAAEVKQLADQTAKATAEISAQIGAIQTATADAAAAIERIGGTIETMSDITATISTAVDGQGAATGEIARNVQEASHGTAEVSDSIAGVTTAAADSSRAAGQVLTSAAELGRQAETLSAEVARFLAGVRAA